MAAVDVIGGGSVWSCERGDAVEWLRGLPDDCADLLFTSPPYELARTYGIGERMVGGQAWVDWMVELVRAAAPKVKGLIAVNCEGQTRGYRYSCVPFLLMADLHRAGFNLRKPPVFHRVGIPGGGGPDWLRNDYEPIVCVTRPGRLPWSDNTACGHPPKWAPGGEASHRTTDGTRVNQWGKTVEDGGPTAKSRKADGTRDERVRPSHKTLTRKERGEIRRQKVAAGIGHKMKNHDSGEWADSTDKTEWNFVPPAVANPGNVIACNVGGGQMGHDLAHENEAPFPLELPAFFVKSFCPPGGLVLEPFAGSGTTIHAAVANGRRAAGCDVRDSQVELVRRRMATVTLPLFAA
jgi:hypothetical protein